MRLISVSTRVSRKGARFSFVDNPPISVYADFEERLLVNGSPFPVISDQSLVPVASALFLLPFQRLTRSKHTADTEADPIFAKRLTIPPEKLKIQAISKEIWGRWVLPRRLQESIIWALVFLPHNETTCPSTPTPFQSLPRRTNRHRNEARARATARYSKDRQNDRIRQQLTEYRIWGTM